MKTYKQDRPNVTALRVMDKKTKEIMKIDKTWPEEDEDGSRRRLGRQDTEDMRVEFERDEKERRRKLRKLLKKNEEMIEQLAKRPDVQRVRERRLFQQVQEGTRI